MTTATVTPTRLLRTEAGPLAAILARGEDSRHQFKRDFTHAPMNPVSANVQTARGLVMQIDIPGGLNKPYVDGQGRILVKAGADKRQVTAREEMQHMVQQAGLLHADEQAAASVSIENNEGTLAQQYRHCMAFLGRNLRNPALASHAFHMLPYQGLGSGIPRAIEDWPHIEFVDDRVGNQFKVVLRRSSLQDGGVSGGVNGGVSGGVNQTSTSSGASKPDEVLGYILAHPGVRAQTIANALGVAVRTIERRLRNLRESGLVEFIGSPKTGGYHAKGATKDKLP